MKYRELDEIQLQAQVDFEKFLRSFEDYMLGERKEELEEEGGTEYGDIYGEEERQYPENRPPVGSPGGRFTQS